MKKLILLLAFLPSLLLASGIPYVVNLNGNGTNLTVAANWNPSTNFITISGTASNAANAVYQNSFNHLSAGFIGDAYPYWTNVNGYVSAGNNWIVFQDLNGDLANNGQWVLVLSNSTTANNGMGWMSAGTSLNTYPWSTIQGSATGPQFASFGEGNTNSPLTVIGGATPSSIAGGLNLTGGATIDTATATTIAAQNLTVNGSQVQLFFSNAPNGALLTTTNQRSMSLGASGNVTNSPLGSAAALWALPQVVPSVGLRSAGAKVSLYCSLYAGNGVSDENTATNTILYAATNGFTKIWTNYGAEVEVWMDGWQSAAGRDANYQPTYNTTKFPHGVANVTAYGHFLGTKVEIFQYFFAQPGQSDSVNLGLYNATDPLTVNQDVNVFYGWNADGVVWGDASQGFYNPGFYNFMARMTAYATASPNGADPFNTFGVSPMENDCFGPPHPGSAGGSMPLSLEFRRMVNNNYDDQGSYGPAPNTYIHDCDFYMFQQRYIWTNYAIGLGPGHRNDGYPASLENSISVNDAWCGLTLNSMFPMQVRISSTNMLAASYGSTYTNLCFMTNCFDPSQAPAFLLADGGNTSTSIWVKPLSGNRFVLECVNQSASPAACQFNWYPIAQSPPGFLPLDSTVYPWAIRGDQTFTVYDCHSNINYIATGGSFTANLAAHTVQVFNFRPNGGIAFSNVIGTAFSNIVYTVPTWEHPQMLTFNYYGTNTGIALYTNYTQGALAPGILVTNPALDATATINSLSNVISAGAFSVMANPGDNVSFSNLSGVASAMALRPVSVFQLP